MRAAADSMIPLISAVGHETDVTLIDFASDKRAPTPTAAAEMAVPVRAELIAELMSKARRALACWQRGQEARRTELRAASRALPNAEELLAIPRQRLDACAERLPRALRANAQIHHTQFSRVAGRLSPQLLRGQVERRRVRLDAARTGSAPRSRPIARCRTHRMSRGRERVTALFERSRRATLALIASRDARLERSYQLLRAFSYQSVLERGFALVRDEAGHPLRSAAAVQARHGRSTSSSPTAASARPRRACARPRAPAPEPAVAPCPRHGSRASRRQRRPPARAACSAEPCGANVSHSAMNRGDSHRAGDLFGHPRGLTYLFTVEMWERFSYYGMRALLVLYMVKHLFQPERAEAVIGFATLKGASKSLFGPLGVQPLASHVYGLYTGLVYLTPVFGGLLADRWLGQRRTVVLGASADGARPFHDGVRDRCFCFALFVLILGNGAFKPNISTQVGSLYAPGDPRRDRAFSIFYVGINLGAFLAPLVCGTLGEELGWHYGFTAAGVGMTLGLAIYLYASRTLPPDVRTARLAAGDERPLGRDEWRAIVALVLLFAAGDVVLGDLRAVRQHHRAVGRRPHRPQRQSALFAYPRHLVPGVQSVHDLRLHAVHHRAVGVAGEARPRAVDRRQDGDRLLPQRGRLSDHGRCRGRVAPAARRAGSGCWHYFVVLTIGELYISPTSLSLVTKVAPARVLSMMMGVWLATSFTGGLLAGYLGSLWSGMGKSDFFLMIAIISALAGVAVLAVARPVKAVLHD